MSICLRAAMLWGANSHSVPFFDVSQRPLLPGCWDAALQAHPPPSQGLWECTCWMTLTCKLLDPATRHCTVSQRTLACSCAGRARARRSFGLPFTSFRARACIQHLEGCESQVGGAKAACWKPPRPQCAGRSCGGWFGPACVPRASAWCALDDQCCAALMRHAASWQAWAYTDAE